VSITLPARATVPADTTTAIPTAPLPVTAAADRVAPAVATRVRVPDNRRPYLAWGLAWLFGHGAFALAGGADPVLPLPGLVPPVLLAVGVLAAGVVTAAATARDQRGVTGPAKTAGTLFGIAWGTGFTALALLITALGQVLGDQLVHTLLWPTGSAVVVGLMYVTGGTLQRDLVQYSLGTYLALLGAGAVLLGTPGHYWALTLAGIPAYLAAAAVEGGRRTAALRRELAAQHARV
jgi:hypothetical protein